MPRVKKPPGMAVDRRNGQRADLRVASGTGVERFSPPETACPEAREAWDQFWDDRPALLLTPSSRVVLLRWVDALHRYLVTTAEADQEPIVLGSTGQPTPNPLYKIADQALRTVETCEKQLGVGGLNASSLGLAAIQERRSLADMNAKYGGGPSGVISDEDEVDDPRVIDAG